jgi:intraflagellar transport protein 56
MDPNPEFWEGKQGACAGAFQQIVAGHEPRYKYKTEFIYL